MRLAVADRRGVLVGQRHPGVLRVVGAEPAARRDGQVVDDVGDPQHPAYASAGRRRRADQAQLGQHAGVEEADRQRDAVELVGQLDLRAARGGERVGGRHQVQVTRGRHGDGRPRPAAASGIAARSAGGQQLQVRRGRPGAGRRRSRPAGSRIASGPCGLVHLLRSSPRVTSCATLRTRVPHRGTHFPACGTASLRSSHGQRTGIGLDLGSEQLHGVDLAEGTPSGTTRELIRDLAPGGRPAGATRPRRPPVRRGILRLAHVDVTVTDLDLATAYYTEVMGMAVSGRDADSVYLRCWDETDHHSLRLRYAPRVGFDLMAYKVHHEDDLDDLENKVAPLRPPGRSGSAKGETLGQGESIRFATPSGHVMELVARRGEGRGDRPRPLEPRARSTGQGEPGPPSVILPPRMDHLLVTAEEVGEATQFYMDVLGLPDHRAAPRRQRPPARHLAGALALTARPGRGARPQRRPAPLRLLARRLGRRPRRGRRAGLQRHPARRRSRPGTASPAARPSTSSTRWAPATRCSPAATAPTPTSRPSPGPRTTSAAPIFYYEGELNDRFMKVHT